VAAAFQNVAEAHQVGLDVRTRILERVAHARLCGQIDHVREALLLEQRVHGRVIGHVHVREGETGVGFKFLQAVLLELHIVVVVQAVQADDGVPGFQKAPGKMKADEPGRAGDENMHAGGPVLALWGGCEMGARLRKAARVTACDTLPRARRWRH